jgi:hypothetical protein
MSINCDEMRKQFEKDISSKFDVELMMMGQAHWYLQARIIIQHANSKPDLNKASSGESAVLEERERNAKP